MRTLSETPLLDVRNLTKNFSVGGLRGLWGRKYVKAVDNISFAMPGERANITALIGESGSGKTTIARLILFLSRPTFGDIFYKGKDIFDMSRKELKTYRAAVQAIFQDPYGIYNPFYRVDRVLEITIKKFKLASIRADVDKLMVESLEAIGLVPRDILGRYPHQLSGGERQRLMLARIYLLKPKLVIADEPISMIDASLRAIFLNMLRDFKEKYDISCLFITHDLNTASYISEDLLILYQGKIVEKGDKTIMDNPFHPYTKMLISSIAIPDPYKRWLDKIDLKVSDIARSAEGKNRCPFYERCSSRMDICGKKEPTLVNIQSSHEVACFLYGK